jgi:NTE family protein
VTAFSLALSGGGLLGAAHLGALEVLDEARLAPTAVSGTSAGGLVASLLALGVSPAAIRQVGADVAAHPARYFSVNVLPLLEDLLPVGSPPATGLIRPDAFLDALLALVPEASTTDQWRLPCALTAVDLAHLTAVAFVNRPVVPARGTWVCYQQQALKLAMQATMALPGLFVAPVFDGRLLVDGGTADTLPVDWAYVLNPGPVLAINVAAPYAVPADRLGVAHILARSEQYATDALSALRDQGLPAFQVTPDTRDVPFLGFQDYDRLVHAGRTAMAAALPAFRQFLDAAATPRP